MSMIAPPRLPKRTVRKPPPFRSYCQLSYSEIFPPGMTWFALLSGAWFTQRIGTNSDPRSVPGALFKTLGGQPSLYLTTSLLSPSWTP